MTQFKDKIVWITGASSGFGEGLAKAFTNAGAKVILSARNQKKLEKVSSEIEGSIALPFDLTDSKQFPTVVKKAIAAFGRLDIVIHNGGVAQKSMAVDTKLSAARHIMEVDYFSYTELTAHLLPYFIEQKSGQIVAVSGLLAKLTLPGRSTYAAAKAALFGYFGCLRAELLPYDVDVTILVPGAMKTALASKAILADGTQNEGAELSKGCPIDLASDQALKAIADRRYEAYIGLKDESYMLYKVSQAYPELAIKTLLNKVKS